MTRRPDPDFWRGRRVLLTGHTGFKGSWAALWLNAMGADVTGLALAPEGPDSLFDLAGVAGKVRSHIADLRDPAAVRAVVAEARPEIVLHMAAQALVRRSVADPVDTIASNVMGTTHLLDALRNSPAALQAILVITSDKVYANHEDGRRTAFVEGDALGGKDPYSASKAATELITRCYARTWFDKQGVRVAAARGGNVIGGGDFSVDRLVPDLVRAIKAGGTLVLRHPGSTRPWQHVLDCLAGYFVYAEALAKGRQGGGEDVPDCLNFGPPAEPALTVGELADALSRALDAPNGWRHEPDPQSVEMPHLAIDAAKAARVLGFTQNLDLAATVRLTADWYRAWLTGSIDLRALTLAQIGAYAGPVPLR